MAFREKSAWVMGAIMIIAGWLYLDTVLAGGADQSAWAVPRFELLIPYVILLVVASVIGQITLALASPQDAAAPAHERERPLLDRAGNWSGLVLGAGAVTALLHFLYHGNAALLFHSIMGSLIVAQIAEYAFQIILLRRA